MPSSPALLTIKSTELTNASSRLSMNNNIDIFQLHRTLQAILERLKQNTIDEASPVLDTSAAAAYIGMSEEWLKKARITGSLSDGRELPVFIKIGRSVKYLKADLDIFLHNRPKYEHLA